MAAAAERKIEPRFPGSWIVSSNMLKISFPLSDPFFNSGITISARIPVGVFTGEISRNKALLITVILGGVDLDQMDAVQQC